MSLILSIFFSGKLFSPLPPSKIHIKSSIFYIHNQPPPKNANHSEKSGTIENGH